MPIRPIDIMKSQEISPLKSYEHNKVQNEQAQIGKHFQDTIQAELKKTTELEKSENKEYRYDAKEKGQNNYQGSDEKKKQTKKDENKDTKRPEKSGSIDILI